MNNDLSLKQQFTERKNGERCRKSGRTSVNEKKLHMMKAKLNPK